MTSIPPTILNTTAASNFPSTIVHHLFTLLTLSSNDNAFHPSTSDYFKALGHVIYFFLEIIFWLVACFVALLLLGNIISFVVPPPEDRDESQRRPNSRQTNPDSDPGLPPPYTELPLPGAAAASRSTIAENPPSSRCHLLSAATQGSPGNMRNYDSIPESQNARRKEEERTRRERMRAQMYEEETRRNQSNIQEDMAREMYLKSLESKIRKWKGKLKKMMREELWRLGHILKWSLKRKETAVGIARVRSTTGLPLGG